MTVLQDRATFAAGHAGQGSTAAAAAVPVRRPAGNPLEMSSADARALSRDLFLRLRQLEEGTREYSYVRGTLIELNTALVKFAAGRFRHRSEPMEDILQVGTVGLIKAIDRFDPTQEYEFVTFALPTITGEIKRFFRDTSWMVHVPRRMQELRLALARASDELEQSLDRAPTSRELADHLAMDEAEVREGLKAAAAYSAHSLDVPAGADDSAGAGGSLSDRFAVEEDGFDAVLHVESLKPLIAALPERERAILSMRFGAEMTQSQIGEGLGLSQMHISRILTRTLKDLRTALLAEE
ncbi:SigB/SigF/SigG family RNA polymerase sigma factor [Kitasatospora sp. NPDC057223]|uniref:SigB/SigF/SigG family RNA polymerase sigma factor n=1 Tax=Kitasatospora sp. NPDC057223 TaxID=3346055 RepID=UPI00362DB1B0